MTSAQYHIGIMHLNGQGVPRDLIRAYMWLDLAANTAIRVRLSIEKASPRQ